MRLRLALAVAAATALSAAPAVAQMPGGGGGMMRQGGPSRMNERLFKGITLTSAEQAKVDSIEQAYQPKMRALFTPGERPHSAARAHMAELRHSENQDLRAVLTADQQKIFDQNVSAMPMYGPRRGPPGGN